MKDKRAGFLLILAIIGIITMLVPEMEVEKENDWISIKSVVTTSVSERSYL